MTMLRIFLDDREGADSLSRLAAYASAPVALTILDSFMLRRAGLLVTDEWQRARYLTPHLSGYGDFSLFLAAIPSGDVYELLKQAKADGLRAVWTITDSPGSLLFRNRYCDRLTMGYVNAAPLEELQSLKWAGVKENIGTINLPEPVGV